MASIQVRTSKSGVKSYRVGYYADGKFRFTPSLASADGAEKIKRMIENPRQGPEVALRALRVRQASTAVTLEEWFRRHLQIKSIHVTDGTIAGYEAEAARTWLPRLGDMPLESITRDVVVDWVTWQMKQPTARSVRKREREKSAGLPLSPLEPVSPKTVRNAHALLSSVLDSAVLEGGHLPSNPAKGVPVPRDGIREEKQIFTREEWDRFYAAMQPEYRALTAFLLVSGARIGEATAARVADLRVRAGTVAIVRAWKKGRDGQVMGVPKSSRSRRVVMLPAWAVELFAEEARGKGPDDLLFTAPRGGRIHGHRYGERQWADALKRAGIGKRLTPHSARHTFASWALMEGVPAQVVQHRLGHESLATTSEVYAHLLLEAQGSAVEAVGWEPAAPALESGEAVPVLEEPEPATHALKE